MYQNHSNTLFCSSAVLKWFSISVLTFAPFSESELLYPGFLFSPFDMDLFMAHQAPAYGYSKQAIQRIGDLPFPVGPVFKQYSVCGFPL